MKPTYVYKPVTVQRHTTRIYATRFPRYHPVIHVTLVHRPVHVHPTETVIHRKVGYVVDIHSRVSEYVPSPTTYSTSYPSQDDLHLRLRVDALRVKARASSTTPDRSRTRKVPSRPA